MDKLSDKPDIRNIIGMNMVFLIEIQPDSVFPTRYNVELALKNAKLAKKINTILKEMHMEMRDFNGKFLYSLVMLN